jgi:hypothetical protein
MKKPNWAFLRYCLDCEYPDNPHEIKRNCSKDCECECHMKDLHIRT